jgi:hypothetical protein
VTGLCFDLVVEIFGTQNGLWTFDEVARGVVPFSGTDEQLALGMPLSMGFAIMCATYLLGADDFLPARWARALTGRQNSTGATLAVSILVFHVVNAVTLVPFLLTRAADLTDVPSSGAAVVDPAPPLGTLVFVVWAALATVAVAWFVRRNQRGSRTTRSYPWLSMLGRKRSESTSRV